MTKLRRFLNTDIPALVQIWNEHFQSLGLRSPLDPSTFHAAILNRTFFDPRQLIVATVDDHPVGWTHWLPVPDKPELAVVPVVCVLPDSLKHSATEIGLALLNHIEKQIQETGCSRIIGGSGPTDGSGYCGVPPLGPGIGIADADRSTSGWFMQLGYSPRRRLAQYEVQLARFRPPIDRTLVQLRRSTTITTQRIIRADARHAAALSHVDQERYITTDRGGAVAAWADFYLSDPEAMVFPVSHAILGACKSVDPEDHGAAVRYTIASGLQQLSNSGVTQVTAVTSDQHPHRTVLLRGLRFELTTEGTLFSKTF